MHEFQTSSHRKGHLDHVLVRLVSDEGAVGWGEIASAAAEPDVHKLIGAERELGGQGEALVFFSGERLSIPAAAQVNAFAASLPELADNVAVHTNEATIPLALAYGQVHGVSGRDVVAAIVAGDEVAKRLHDSYFFAKLEPPEFPIGNASVLGTVGATVTAEATLQKVNARRLTFTVSVADDNGLVAAGIVTRVIVDLERFLETAH